MIHLYNVICSGEGSVYAMYALYALHFSKDKYKINYYYPFCVFFVFPISSFLWVIVTSDIIQKM